MDQHILLNSVYLSYAETFFVAENDTDWLRSVP
jgi:hypothetical protein